MMILILIIIPYSKIKLISVHLFFTLWPLVIFAIISLEIFLRITNNRMLRLSNLEKKLLSNKYNNLDNSNSESNMTDEDLEKLGVEYGEHVQRCMVHYGTWSNAIKSEESMHMPDYQGKFLNVVNGMRVTTDNPTVSKKRIIIFGGSTVFCGEVPDNLTSCSLLQAAINANKIPGTVINFGRHGSTLQNRLLYLERSNFKRDDLILFWFGVNELGWKLMEGKTNAPFFIYSLKRVSEGLKFFSKFLALISLLSQLFESFVLKPLSRFLAYLELKRSLEKLKNLSRLRGFEYRVFLQPNLLTKTVRTRREDLVLEYFLSSRRGRTTKNFLDANYPKFRALLDRYMGVDASGIFSSANREVFVDWCHLNSAGNQVVAQFIFERLREFNLLNTGRTGPFEGLPVLND